jgi:hypothetical protein
MNSKKIILLICMALCVFAVSPATAQMRGHRASMARMPMRGAPMPRSMGRMPMQHRPILNSASRFHHFNDGDFDRDDRFHHNNRTFIFVDSFGFPFFYPFPYFGYYPYGYYPYGYYGDDYDGGSGYGSSYSSRSTVAETQRLLARAGYYHGAIDGIMGPQTRRAIRAYERDHNVRPYGAMDQGLLFENQNKS